MMYFIYTIMGKTAEILQKLGYNWSQNAVAKHVNEKSSGRKMCGKTYI